mgnify:CR=1 FL=1
MLSDAHPERLDQWLNEIDPPVRPFVAGAAVRSLAELPLAEIIVECRGGQQTGERSQSAHDHELPQEFDVEPLAVALADRGRVGDALEEFFPAAAAGVRQHNTGPLQKPSAESLKMLLQTKPDIFR